MPAEDIRHPEKQPIVFERRSEKIQKTKRETNAVGTEIHPRKEVLKMNFPNTRKHSQRGVCGEPWNLRGQHNREEK